MRTPAILALSTGVPPARYSQADILEQFLMLQGKDSRRSRAIRVVFERAGVGFRHMVVGDGYFAEERRTLARNERYMAEALPLSERTIRRAMDSAGVAPDQIDDFVVVSCTGFNIPGLDLHLAGRLGMRHDLRRTCVLGMGCYGAFPGLLRARDAVLHSSRLALVLAVELCSLHMQHDDSTENVVSSALFSDGAAVALVGLEGVVDNPNGTTPRLVAAATHSDYTTLDHMSFTLTDHGFRMYLSSYVPDLLAANIESFVDGILSKQGLQRADVNFWGIHPGSSKIVDYVQARLGLSNAQVELSHSVLYDYGNMSSATILFVLDRIQQCSHPSPGDYIMLLAFGPGLTMEGLLLQC